MTDYKDINEALLQGTLSIGQHGLVGKANVYKKYGYIDDEGAWRPLRSIPSPHETRTIQLPEVRPRYNDRPLQVELARDQLPALPQVQVYAGGGRHVGRTYAVEMLRHAAEQINAHLLRGTTGEDLSAAINGPTPRLRVERHGDQVFVLVENGRLVQEEVDRIEEICREALYGMWGPPCDTHPMEDPPGAD
jgi:hypothetical protein